MQKTTINKLLAALLFLIMVLCIIPVSVFAETPLWTDGLTADAIALIIGNSVYRSSAESATVKLLSDTNGTAYYKITDSETAPVTDDLSDWTNGGTVTAGTTKSIDLSGLTAGPKYVHIVVNNTVGVSNMLTISMPQNYYYHEDFEAYPENTYVAQSGSPLAPIRQKDNGNGDDNQKVASGSGNRYLSLTSASSWASMQKVDLFPDYRDGVGRLVLKGKVMPLSEGPLWHEAALFGIGDRKSGVLFIGGKICYVNKQDINNITYSFDQWYEIELDINLITNKYDIKVNGTTVATDVTYNDSDKFVCMFAGHSTTAYFDDITFYTMNKEPVEGKTVNVSDTVYNGSEQKQAVTVEGLVEGTDFDVAYSADCTNVGTVTVTVIGKGNYFGTLTTTYNITKADRTAPVVPDIQSIGINSITLKTVEGCEYSIDGTVWQDGNVFDGLTVATEYVFYQRYKETTNYKSSPASSASISTHTHYWQDTWLKDETHHWHECACGAKKDEAAHIYSEHTTTKAPTHTESGTEEAVCVCGQKKTETIPATGHSFSTAWSKDETHHWHECACSDTTDKAAHSFGEWITTKAATENEKGEEKRVCICDYAETREIPMVAHIHIPGTEWKHTDTEHWHECSCGEKLDQASHSLGEWTITKQATFTDRGEKMRVCECGYEEIVDIDALKKAEYLYDGDTDVKLIPTGNVAIHENTILVANDVTNTLSDDELSAIVLSGRFFSDEVLAVYEITIKLSGERVQPDGEVKVELPIPTPKEGKIFTSYKVAYIDENNTAHTMPTEVKDGKIIFTTDHFSRYVVVGTAEETPSQSGMPTWVIVLIACAGAIAVAGIAVLFIVKKKKVTK